MPTFVHMILVTGGTGIVGAHLLYELAARNKKVRALKRAGSNTGMVERMFDWYDRGKGGDLFGMIEWMDGDINDLTGLQEAMDGIQSVYHCAAMVSFMPQDRQAMMKANVDGTANVVNVALQKGVSGLCHCSSVAALGQPQPGDVIDENLVWKTSGSHSWYAMSKYGAEREVWRASEEGLNVVIVNPTVVIGPGDPARSSAQFYQSVARRMKFYTKGVTGFVDARDVATAMVDLLESPVERQRFILSSENLSYKQVFSLLAKHAGVKPPSFYAGRFMSGVAWRLEALRSLITRKKPLLSRETAQNAHHIRYFSNQKAKDTLGIRFRTIDEAAKNTAGFFRENPSLLTKG